MTQKRLSQSEIEELFKAAKSGDDELYETITKQNSREFIEYDFEKPDRFNIDNMKSLHNISSAFARDLSDFMTASLHTEIEFQVNQSIEQTPYGTDYMANLRRKTHGFVITDMGGEGLGKIIIEADLALLIAIHRKMMGAKEIEITDERKPLTDIEIISTKLWMQKWMFTRLKDSFQHIADMNFRIDSVEKDIQHIRVTEQTDMVAIVTFDVYMGSKKSDLRMVIPYKSIEKVVDKMTAEVFYRGETHDEDPYKDDKLKEHLKRIDKEVEIELGKSNITLRELIDLTEGDVLILDKKFNEHLVGNIEQKPKFSCVMGKKGNKISVKVTSFAEKGGLTEDE